MSENRNAKYPQVWLKYGCSTVSITIALSPVIAAASAAAHSDAPSNVRAKRKTPIEASAKMTAATGASAWYGSSPDSVAEAPST